MEKQDYLDEAYDRAKDDEAQLRALQFAKQEHEKFVKKLKKKIEEELRFYNLSTEKKIRSKVIQIIDELNKEQEK